MGINQVIMKRFIPFLLFLFFSTLITAQIDSSKAFTENGVSFISYRVSKGKTLYSISKETKVSQDSLLLYNPFLSNGLKTGMELKIPTQNKIELSNFVLHTVLAKETLYGISLKYGVSISELKASNPGLEKGIHPGMVIKINSKNTDSKTKTAETEVKDTLKSKNHQINKTAIECPIQEERLQKNEINIALLLPLFIGKSEELNPKAKIGLDFYSGAKLALDSLKKEGLNAEIFIYDTRNDSATISEIINKPAFKFMDLIIGPLYTSGFKQVADFAKQNKICILSPFSHADAILKKNPHVLKFTSDNKSMLEKTVKFYSQEKKNAAFTLVYNKNEPDRIVADSLKSLFNSKPETTFKSIEFTSVVDLSNQLSEAQENIIIFPSTVQIQVIDFTSRLNNLKTGKKITLIGLNEWNAYENIDFDDLNSLNFVYASQMHNNFEETKNTIFRTKFKLEYKADPSQYAFQGFDVTYFAAKQLKLYGKSFNFCLKEIKTFCGFNSCYKFVQQKEEDGFENNYVNIIQLVDFKPTKINQ
jgi:LysM repeat protein/ABC-type branched-subunit amino acid transport system substrate-binding protein